MRPICCRLLLVALLAALLNAVVAPRNPLEKNNRELSATAFVG